MLRSLLLRGDSCALFPERSSFSDRFSNGVKGFFTPVTRAALSIAVIGQTLRDRLDRRRNAVPTAILVHDVTIAVTALTIAYYMPLGRPSPEALPLSYYVTLPIFAAVTVVVFLSLNIHRRMWRHSSFSDYLDLARASAFVVILGSLASWLLAALSQLPIGVPRSVPLGHWPLFLVLLAGGRFAWRWMVEKASMSAAEHADAAPVLVVGSGIECSLLLRGISQGSPATLAPVGILGIGQCEVGRSLLGVPVLGKIEDLPEVVGILEQRGLRPQQVIVTQRIAPPRLLDLIAQAEELGLATFELPSPGEMRAALREGKTPAEPISLPSLLGRSQVQLDHGAISDLISGRRVLVTGAGGSIGQEIVRCIAEQNPEEMALIDNCEFNLYKIDMEMAVKYSSVSRKAFLTDIRNAVRVNQVFEEVRPEIVFHAAALKHVPMVELNPAEGVLTNVVGSRNIADATLRCGARAMVQISTDKAVNPVSMMGATKRLAELYCQALDLEASVVKPSNQTDVPRFMTVRFGNVLGSSGSVVPLFQRQIEAGGPVTVTHADMERYFMTIREASALVLQAAAHGVKGGFGRGTVFVLDMGEPVRILDIARQMIRLHGKAPDKDIRIEFVGLRPGEKLLEELFDSDEIRLAGPAEGVLAAKSSPLALSEVRALIAELQMLAEVGDECSLRTTIAGAIPGSGRRDAPHGAQAAA